MDTEQKKAIVKEIKSLLMNDQGIQASISNIRAQNNDPYRVFTEIVTQNDRAQDMIGKMFIILKQVKLKRRDSAYNC
jgi:RNA-binding protein YhbY